MFTKRERQNPVSNVSLLRYWTWRYTLLLLVLLIGIGILGINWTRDNSLSQQVEVLEARTELLAAYYSESMDQQLGLANPSLSADTNSEIAIRTVPAISAELFIQIYALDKHTFDTDSPNIPDELRLPPSTSNATTPEKSTETINTKQGRWLRTGMPYFIHQQFAGKYYVSTRVNNSFEKTYILILVSIGVIALFGWMVVYILSRSLTRPLRQLAIAARQISDGNYKPDLPDAARIKEAEINQLVHSFDEMTTRLEQLERMRIDLLAGVSHELRTPVTSIRGMIQAVKDGVVTGAKADKFMQISMDEAKRLQTMVNELLDFSAMETDTILTVPDSVSLVNVLNEVVAQLRMLPVYASLDLTTDVSPRELAWTGDRMHLKQIVLNLMNNSAASGARRIAITVRKEGRVIRIDVTDDGKGIPPEETSLIFERYYRGDSRRKKKQGLGLGLPICQILAKANNGKVELLQSSQAGTVFRITLRASIS